MATPGVACGLMWVGRLRGLSQRISSTPLDPTLWNCRCAKPHCTNHSTERYTASRLVLESSGRLPPTTDAAPMAPKNTHHGQDNRPFDFAPGNVFHHHPVQTHIPLASAYTKTK